MAARSGASKGASNAHQPSLASRPLRSLIPGEQLSANTKLEGKLVSIVPYDVSTRTCAFSIVQSQSRVKCLLRGTWSTAAPEFLRANLNRQIRILTDGTETVKVVSQERDRNGEPVFGGNQLGISFENGIKGYWRDERGSGRKEPFQLKKTTAQPNRVVELSSEPDRSSRQGRPAPARSPALNERTNVRPPAAASDPAESSSAALNKKLQVPMPSPAADPVVRMVQSPTPPTDALEALAKRRGPSSNKREAPSSSPARSAAATSSEKATAKRQRKEERTEWGLTTETHTYLSLSDFMTKKPKPADRSVGLHVIAVARTLYEPRQMPGQDYGVWLELYDPTFTKPGGVHVRYYALAHLYSINQEVLPSPRDGDIIVIQRVVWTEDRKQFTAYKEKGEYFILSPDELLKGSPLSSFTPPSVRAATLTEAELNYARDLARWSRRNGLEQQVRGEATNGTAVAAEGGGLAAPTTDVKLVSASLARGRGGRPTLLIQDIVPDVFCDLYAEIVRWYNPHATRQIASNDYCNLFVTDYTTNPELIEYQDDSKNGVPGQHVLQVSIFGAQCEPLMRFSDSDLKGRIVHLRNIRPKSNMNGLLEATMVEDHKFADKRDVTLVGKLPAVGRAKDWFDKLTGRRKTFWSQASIHGGAAAAEPAAANPTADGALPAQGQATTIVDPLTEISDVRGLREVHSLVGSVALDSPGTYRCRVRVIDYYPPRLEDWVYATCPECQESLGPSEATCISHGKVTHRWMFCLALADESDAACHVKVFVDEAVAGQQSELKLLTGMSEQDAAQVRSGDTNALRRFREVLRGILGSIPDAHRHKKEILHGMAGPAWDVVLEADRVEEGKPVEWRFKPGKVMFE
ncbi:hypothetical protein JCM10908_006822 [Rhodotorula pacifica]|uniref:uncharacterized protein n=1 Tax=Rhodotorula pacifica TaxID=1495444 RepID=UPI003181BC59